MSPGSSRSSPDAPSQVEGIQAGVLAYNGTEAVSLGDGLLALPIATLLS